MNLNRFKKAENLPNIIVLLITYILYFLSVFLVFRYIKLNLVLFLIAFAVLFILILLFGIISFEGIIENNKKLRLIGLISLSIISLILTLSVFYISRINSSINNIIVSPNQNTELQTAFVVFDTEKYKDVKDLSGLKMGILSNSEGNDRNSFVKNEVEVQGLNITFVEYLSYNELLLGL